jgi:hypothetical protein
LDGDVIRDRLLGGGRCGGRGGLVFHGPLVGGTPEK